MEDPLPPGWENLDRQMGQLFMMGFDGTTVDSQIRSLIQNYHLGSILLSAKNLKSAADTARLAVELQTIARDAGHPVPLAIALDQENGSVNSLFDQIYIRQFPSAMGITATGSKQLARQVALATAHELKAVGVNWILGPVLDVLTSGHNQPLGVRTSGDDPQEVSQYGVEFMKGYQEAGLVTCGKHFPSYGNLEFLGSQADVPIITESLEQLSLSALVPFRNAIAQGLDAMIVGGVALSSAGVNVMHACLSEQVVDDLLRKDLKFDGVVVSECLGMEALTHNIGIGGGTVMAVKAGCDMILLCRSFASQKEAITGLKLGVENGIINRDRIGRSLRRVLAMKSRCTSWEQALDPGSISSLTKMQPSHTALSARAYNSSITVVRDRNSLLPLSSVLEPDEELLLLTPLVKPLLASAVSRSVAESINPAIDPLAWERTASIMSGESVFREFGRSLARQRNGRVLHTSYTASGVRPMHENLVDRANAVVVVTADATRNLYQYGFTKHVSMICKSYCSPTGERREKPLIVVSVSSPYDFAIDPSIGTYVCTYDFTETALQTLVKVLYGNLSPSGSLPGSMSRSYKLQQSRQQWLVQTWNEERDAKDLDTLLAVMREDASSLGQRSELANVTSNGFLLRCDDVDEAHFVVRNSSTGALYGFCSTYSFRSTGTGVIGSLIVDPTRQKLSIGHSLHNWAIKTLLQRKVKRFQLGSRLPNVYLGIPTTNPIERKKLRQWFSSLGWNTALSRPVCSMVLRNLSSWVEPEELATSLQITEVNYDLICGSVYAESVLDLIGTNSRQGIMEVYKLALNDPSHCWIIRAKRPEDDVVLASIVVYDNQSILAEYVPALKDSHAKAGGISSPVISPSVGQYATLMQGLILLGIREVRKRDADTAILDCVDGDGNVDSLCRMGFSVLHSFEEVTCDAATWNIVQPT